MARWLAAALLLPNAASAAELGGTWEIQSMGGDRKVEVQQRGDKLIAHRVMWPTFEGQKYKLEHLYRGTISGSTIRGELLVREEDLSDYEILRSFDGSIATHHEITIDGIPMKRTGGGGTAPKAESRPPPSDAPPPPPPAPAEPEEPPPGSNPGASLFARIMSSPGMENLFEDALKVEIPKAVAELTAEGDALFARARWQAALAKFEEASNTGGGTDPQLLHRTGRCLLKLKRWSEAQKTLRSALKLDPSNKQIKRDYKKAKRRSR